MNFRVRQVIVLIILRKSYLNSHLVFELKTIKQLECLKKR